MIGRAILYTGLTMIVAAALRAILDLLRLETIDAWSVVLAVGCIMASIGLGLTGVKPWEKITKASKQIKKNVSELKI
ncbi:hypothetical protein GWO43_11095 [candidate division KSB1 bacterium]|nr:hypothetical protein [candidate division KSB1 bacterium]NIR70362.1 hypothetical protein [candidate division KSB1 bacterium]NIS24486.1 hypothetical protein [candidate division KSB1 bacterium]NIT71414.1 hypothetical protein [candidate division KSB1 bacterium]NIU25092.1 hypothetical protein [candidate division KSB1 bacterium]